MFFLQAEDGIRDLVRSRGLGDVYKRQVPTHHIPHAGQGIIGEPETRRTQRDREEAQHQEELSLIHI